MRETFDQLVARVNSSSFVPPPEKTAVKILSKKFAFPKHVAKAGTSKHDWDLLLDGTARLMIKGEDYDCDTDAFRAMFKSRAAARGQEVQSCKVNGDEPTSKAEDVTGVAIQATTRPDAQKAAAWKANYDAQAAARKAKKAAGSNDTAEAHGDQEEPLEQEVA